MRETKYSIVIPCYKSAQTIKKVVSLTAQEMDRLGKTDYEFLLVNDCSPDDGETSRILAELAEEFSYVKVIELAKNAGQHNAIMAGFNYCTGDVIIGMDDDGQTHPSQLEKLFNEFEKGHDVVYGYYPEKKHNLFRNFGSYINHLSVRILIKKPKWLRTSSYFIIRKFVKDSVIKYKSSYAYMQGLFLRTTKDIVCVPVEHFKREVGTSNYTFKKLIRLWSSIIGFSVVPLRISSLFGYAFSAFGLLGGIAVFIKKLINPSTAIGWPSVMIAIFIFSGINLLFLGLLGEYIGRMFLGQNNDPQFVVKCTKNIQE